MNKTERIQKKEAIRILLIQADRLVRDARTKFQELYPNNLILNQNLEDLLRANLELSSFIIEEQNKD